MRKAIALLITGSVAALPAAKPPGGRRLALAALALVLLVLAGAAGLVAVEREAERLQRACEQLDGPFASAPRRLREAARLVRVRCVPRGPAFHCTWRARLSRRGCAIHDEAGEARGWTGSG